MSKIPDKERKGIQYRLSRSPSGFWKGANNKIRVIQRRAYGLRDDEYLRLKILTAFLPELWKGPKMTYKKAGDPEILPTQPRSDGSPSRGQVARDESSSGL
ncbi:MAG: transposase [candidate division NC10 bacterium]|nr:transposase [candidate division NC10 bacterium]